MVDERLLTIHLTDWFTFTWGFFAYLKPKDLRSSLLTTSNLSAWQLSRDTVPSTILHVGQTKISKVFCHQLLMPCQCHLLLPPLKNPWTYLAIPVLHVEICNYASKASWFSCLCMSKKRQ